MKTPEPFSWPIRIYYEDTDAAGVVYYANYLRFLERARTEWLRELGFELGELEREQRCLFAVRRVAIDYRGAARLGELLNASVLLQHYGHSRISLKQSVLRKNQVLCEAEVVLVCVHSQTWKPFPIPDSVRNTLGGLV